MSAILELLALLNTANDRSYTETQVEFDDPVAITDPEVGQPNTTVVVSGIESAGYINSKELSYTRLELAQTFTGRTLTSAGPATAGTLQEVLDDVFAETGVRIYPADLQNAAAVDFSQPSITLTAKTTSLKWLGSVVVNTSVDLRDIETEITVATLPGFEYPALT